jgi:hypothetical protein
MKSSVLKLAVIALVILSTGCVGKRCVRGATDDTVADGTWIRDQVALDFVNCLFACLRPCSAAGFGECVSSIGNHTSAEIETCGGVDMGFLHDGYMTKDKVIQKLGKPSSTWSTVVQETESYAPLLYITLVYELVSEDITYSLVLRFRENNVLVYHSCQRQSIR